MGYWLRGHICCFSKIQQVGQKYRDKTTLAKRDSAAIVLIFKVGAFHYLVGYNI